ncbi:hypothetical protein HYH03_001478 [Edaphochlamys debaryana]|uniref:asparaginase n=1 Tax=Edaphochlamys debaryana TaxID=47281 RepID=A0A836C636_9CHLO|nr:hypothetical protein HYH03_001478 [Edaphochlamys debaryana]|eukprot:KAG2500713.1 hypothetical protein HYH03_001478 [Edaphochlamys debaryana]
MVALSPSSSNNCAAQSANNSGSGASGTEPDIHAGHGQDLTRASAGPNGHARSTAHDPSAPHASASTPEQTTSVPLADTGTEPLHERPRRRRRRTAGAGGDGDSHEPSTSTSTSAPALSADSLSLVLEAADAYTSGPMAVASTSTMDLAPVAPVTLTSPRSQVRGKAAPASSSAAATSSAAAPGTDGAGKAAAATSARAATAAATPHTADPSGAASTGACSDEEGRAGGHASDAGSPGGTYAAAGPGPSLRAAPGPGRLRTVTKPLPRVLFLHTGGTLGMDPEEAFEEDEGHNLRVRAGAADVSYKGQLRPGEMLSNLLTLVPELEKFANVDLQVLFNKDSSRVGPSDWVAIAKALDHHRPHYDAFVVVHGTDTLAYTAAALSLMLQGFKKPIVMTGSQLPLRAPRTDARQNLLDSITVATSAFSPPHVALQEVAVCFGGKLMRGNRTQKVNSAAYQAFDSLTYPYLATLGIDVDWNTRFLLRVEGAYTPRFKLDPRVIRIPVVPGSDPRMAYGDLYGRGVRGVVLEAFGVGNLPDQTSFGWLPWLREQTARGLQVCLTSQCSSGPLQPGIYRAGQLAAAMGVDAGPTMTPECAAVKLMFCLQHPDLALGVPLAGEL